MHWNTSLLSASNPFLALRRDFERKVGLEGDSGLAGLTVVEAPEYFSVQLDVPGMSESDINVSLHDDHLIIEGERKARTLSEGKEIYNDRVFRSFRRVLRLQEPVDRNAIEAELSNGVLTLKLRRVPEVQPQKIAIRTVQPEVAQSQPGA